MYRMQPPSGASQTSPLATMPHAPALPEQHAAPLCLQQKAAQHQSRDGASGSLGRVWKEGERSRAEVMLVPSVLDDFLTTARSSPEEQPFAPQILRTWANALLASAR